MKDDIKEALQIKWGDELVPVVEFYKYLGILLDEKFPLPAWSIRHYKKVMGRADYAYHQCSYWLSKSSADVDWKIQNFSAMVVPQFFYGIELWSTPGAIQTELIVKYNTLLRRSLNLSKQASSAVVAVISQLHPLQYWEEYFKVLMKYRQLKNGAAGPDKWVIPDLPDSDIAFAKWYRSDDHAPPVGGRLTEIELKDMMHKWEKKWILNKLTESGRNPSFARFAAEVDWKKINLAKCLTNTEFSMVCNSINGANGLCSNVIICNCCGLHPRTWDHVTRCSLGHDLNWYHLLLGVSRREYVSLMEVSNGEHDFNVKTDARTSALDDLRILVGNLMETDKDDLSGWHINMLNDDWIEQWFVVEDVDGMLRCFNKDTFEIKDLSAQRLSKWKQFTKMRLDTLPQATTTHDPQAPRRAGLRVDSLVPLPSVLQASA